MFWLEPGPLNQAERNVVYLCRPQVKYMQILAGQSLFLFSPTFSQLFETHSSWIDGLEQIKSTPSPNNHVYHLFVVPRMTKLCTSILEDMGVLGSIEIQDFMLGLIPIDKDVLSLEYEDVYKTIMLVSSQNERLYLPCISDQSEKLTKEGVSEWVQDNDIEPIYDMAKALMTLQRAFGTIPRLIGKGTSSRVRLSLFHSSSTRSVRWLFFLSLQRLVDLMKRLHREQSTHPSPSSSSTSSSSSSNPTPSSSIPLANGTVDSMIVLDRQVDMISALCTQLTYQGLVDEMVGIKNCNATLPSLFPLFDPFSLKNYSLLLYFLSSTRRSWSSALEPTSSSLYFDSSNSLVPFDSPS